MVGVLSWTPGWRATAAVQVAGRIDGDAASTAVGQSLQRLALSDAVLTRAVAALRSTTGSSQAFSFQQISGEQARNNLASSISSMWRTGTQTVTVTATDADGIWAIQ
jgi:hypothetical protein